MKCPRIFSLRSASSLWILALAIALFLAPSASAQPSVYVVTFYQQFGTVNLATGTFQQIGASTPEPLANLVWGPDRSLFSLSVFGNLVKINPATGEISVIGQTGLGVNAFDLAEARGVLYATDLSNNLYTVDPHTGVATLFRATGIPPNPAYPFTSNPDGTINLCDQSLYGFAGKLYATFDAFTLDAATLTKTPVVAPVLYEIDPHSGISQPIASTILNLGASVEVNGRFFGFHWVSTGFSEFGPQIYSELGSIDVTNGNFIPLHNIDASAGGITGAAPVRGR